MHAIYELESAISLLCGKLNTKRLPKLFSGSSLKRMYKATSTHVMRF